MIKQITKVIDQMEHVSYRLAKYGMMLCCLILAGCVAAQYINNNAISYSLTLYNHTRTMAEVAVAVFAEVVIGSFLFDYYAKKHTANK